MKKVNEHVLSILADNEVGVLTRIINAVRREGCNIKSVTAARTTDKRYARITINVESYDYMIEDIISKIRALSCVRNLQRYEENSFVEREYAIFSVMDDCSQAQDVIKKYNAQKIHDCIYELSGARKTVSACIAELALIAEVEIARTGSIILHLPEGEQNG